MDGQNFNNEQSTVSQDQSAAQYTNYQDNTTTNTYYQSTPVVENVSEGKANGMQIGALICGIAAIVFSCCCYGILSIILGIVGAILAVNGNKQGKNGVGTAGLVCSIIGIVLGIVIGLIVGLVFGFSLMAEM